MDEINRSLPPELESAMREYYAAPGPSPEFASRLDHELHRRYLDIARASKPDRGSFMKTLRARPALAILFVILALLLLSGAAYAIGRLTGFIPGFGFTSGDVYVLDMPIEVGLHGVVVGVENAVQDGTSLWVELSVRNLQNGEDTVRASILSGNGEKIQSQRGGSIIPDAGTWQMTYVFPPLNQPRRPVILLLEDLGGETFQIEFTLRPARAEEILPVLSGSPLPIQGETREGMSLALEHVAMSADRTVLQVSLQFDRPEVSLAGPWGVTMTDEAGRIYPLTDITPGTMDMGMTRVYQTSPLHGNERITLELVGFPANADMPMLMDVSTSPAQFTFDPGANPRIGQTWSLDESLRVDRFDLHLVGARMSSTTELLFEFEPIQNITGVMLYSTLASGASGGMPVSDGKFSAGMRFGKMPNLPFEVQIRGIYFTAHGPWSVKWQAPVPAALNFPTMTPAPSPTPMTIPTLASQDPLLLEVQTLSQKFEGTIVQGPGWVHVIYENFIEHREPGQTYPPPYYLDEQWYELDAAGWVIRSLTTHRDEQGGILQQAASLGTKSLNLTTGDVFENSPYRLSLDFLVRDLDSALQRNQPVQREETTCEDGSSCLLITVLDQFSQPLQSPGQPAAYYGRGLRVWINLGTGQQVKYQSFWQMADGTERVDFTQRVSLIEKVLGPPREVLDILNRIVFP